MLAVNIYGQYSVLLQSKNIAQLDSFNRAFVVQSIDTGRREIIALSLRNRGVYDRILFFIPKDAKIQRQTPRIENGVVTGFSPIVPATFEELLPGVHGYAYIRTDNDGRFVAQSILIGDPFPRL